MKRHQRNLYLDLSVIAISFGLAYFLARSGAVESLIASSQAIRPLGSFVAGMFYVSLFTAAPATTVIVEIAQSNSIYIDALWAALGGVVGDLLILRFVRDRFSNDVRYLLGGHKIVPWLKRARRGRLRWLFVALGAVIMASPLPDEIGIFFMGFSRIPTRFFLPVSFALNFLGILAIAAIGKAVAS